MMEALLFELEILGLDFHGWLTLMVVLGATIVMAAEKLGADLVMFSAICILVVAGVVSPELALQGFSNPAVVTIGVLFVIARAMQETGALYLVSTALFGRERQVRPALMRLVVPTAAMSAFMNNTPIVAMFIPIVRTFSRRIGSSPSRFLIPLSYASMLGGTCTLIGTSSNLIVSGMLGRDGQEPLGMFELTWVGLPTVVLGLAYLVTLGVNLLPDRRDPTDAAQDEAREYMAEVRVAPDSPLIDRSVEDASLRNLPGLYLVEIRRESGEIVRPVAPYDRLRGGDHLVFTGLASTLEDVASMPGLVADHAPSDRKLNMYEVVISHHSGLVGRTVRASDFRRRFDAAILAVHRAGERIESKIGDIILQPGDTLLLTASPGFLRAHRHSPHFYLVSERPHEGQPRYDKMPVAVLALLVMVILPATTEVTMLVSSMAALVILLATRCVSPRSARDSVNWPVLMLIGSALGVSAALDASGAAARLAGLLVSVTADGGPLALLAGVYLMTALFACFIGNAAAAALVFPVALSAAANAGLDPRPFAVAIAMGASAAFSTPVGYAANLLVYGPGGYRYLDFTRVGLPLNVLCFIIAMTIVPRVWPLLPV